MHFRQNLPGNENSVLRHCLRWEENWQGGESAGNCGGSGAHVASAVSAEACVLLPDPSRRLQMLGAEPSSFNFPDRDQNVADWVFDHGERAGLGTTTLPGARALFLPFSPQNGDGVLAVRPPDARPLIPLRFSCWRHWPIGLRLPWNGDWWPSRNTIACRSKPNSCVTRF